MAEVDGGVIEIMAGDHRPQVKLIAVVATCEAMPGLLFKMDAECAP